MAYTDNLLVRVRQIPAGTSLSVVATAATVIFKKVFDTGEQGWILSQLSLTADVAITTTAGTILVKKNGTLVYTFTVPILAAAASHQERITYTDNNSNVKYGGIDFRPGDTLQMEIGTAVGGGGTVATVDIIGGIIPQ